MRAARVVVPLAVVYPRIGVGGYIYHEGLYNQLTEAALAGAEIVVIAYVVAEGVYYSVINIVVNTEVLAGSVLVLSA